MAAFDSTEITSIVSILELVIKRVDISVLHTEKKENKEKRSESGCQEHNS